MGRVFRLSLRNLASNRLRSALTTFAVLLGVSFIVASFVLRDGLLDTFDTLVEEANAELDPRVIADQDFDEVDFTDRPFDESLLGVVQAVEGVAEAVPGLESTKVIPIKADGEPIETTGAPILSFNWSGSALDPLKLAQGDAPDGPGEFAIDIGTAERDNLLVGETYDVVGVEGREPFELTGLTGFGDENSLAGAVLISFTLEELQRLDGSDGLIRRIDVAADAGIEPDVLVDRLQAALPAGFEAVSGDVIVASDQDDFSFFVDIFGNILLAFALVAVFVSIFIIYNTFNILLGQRVRQLALLRALGASARQVRASTIFEALIVGVVASLLGLAGGMALALGLRALLNVFGFSLPSMSLILSPRTIVWAFAVGIIVTLLAAMSPAKRASKVPPVAAMRAGFRFGAGEGKKRTIYAIVWSALGVALIGFGLFGSSSSTALLLSALGAGAALVFIGIAMFAPLFSSPTAALLGWPLEHIPWAKITGHMAHENASHNNKRTASTAAGLMIGLALIAMATVVATSLKESFKSELSSTLVGDWLVTSQNDGTFSNLLADEIKTIPELGAVSAVRYGNVRIDGDEKAMAATDLTVLTDLLDVNILAGDPVTSARPDFVLLTEEAAEDNGVVVGDQLSVEFAASGTQTLTVGAIYENDFLIGHYILDLSGWDENFDEMNDAVISAKTAAGVDQGAAAAALAPYQDAFPQLEFETRSEFHEHVEGQLDSFLAIINVMLLLAIVIALLGITNTMALSVLERTQEIGLMRAIGMTRGQTRGMICLEAGVVSLFGALLGVVVGMAFGWLLVIAIPDSIISQLAVPVPTLIVYVLVASVAGLLVALLPARRAARMNVLDAIAQI